MLYTTDAIFKALSDGYNPTYLRLNFGDSYELKESDYLVWDLDDLRTESDYIEFINKHKTKIIDARTRIKENLFWSVEHLKTFNKIPEVFDSTYNYDFLDKYIKEVAEKINNVISTWDYYYSYELDIYAGQRRVLIIKGSEKTLILDIINDIH